MIACDQQLDLLVVCGKPAKRQMRFPWDPMERGGCCEDCLAEYIANGDFTPEEAERFFPIIEESTP